MSEQHNDGGPVFPAPPSGDSRTDEDGTTYWQFPAQSGMSLRDWFAGQALAGFGACPTMWAINGRNKIAQEAYQAADAMLTARQTKGTTP